MRLWFHRRIGHRPRDSLTREISDYSQCDAPGGIFPGFFVLLGFATANYAAGGRAEKRIVASIMPSDAADNRALDAALGIGWEYCRRQNKSEDDKCKDCFHFRSIRTQQQSRFSKPSLPARMCGGAQVNASFA
jgi:hypothetical protein